LHNLLLALLVNMMLEMFALHALMDKYAQVEPLNPSLALQARIQMSLVKLLLV
jgi:hypothetical protein